jgi:CHASE3 domain sensor protein
MDKNMLYLGGIILLIIIIVLVVYFTRNTNEHYYRSTPQTENQQTSQAGANKEQNTSSLDITNCTDNVNDCNGTLTCGPCHNQ